MLVYPSINLACVRTTKLAEFFNKEVLAITCSIVGAKQCMQTDKAKLRTVYQQCYVDFLQLTMDDCYSLQSTGIFEYLPNKKIPASTIQYLINFVKKELDPNCKKMKRQVAKATDENNSRIRAIGKDIWDIYHLVTKVVSLKYKNGC